MVAQLYWELAAPLPWGDAHLPDGWHLSRRRVPVPAIPRSGRKQTEEILRRRSFLPPDLMSTVPLIRGASLYIL